MMLMKIAGPRRGKARLQPAHYIHHIDGNDVAALGDGVDELIGGGRHPGMNGVFPAS